MSEIEKLNQAEHSTDTIKLSCQITHTSNNSYKWKHLYNDKVITQDEFNKLCQLYPYTRCKNIIVVKT